MQGFFVIIFRYTWYQSLPPKSFPQYFYNLPALFYGIFHPNSVAVALYGTFIRAKSPTNCNAHLAESPLEARSEKAKNTPNTSKQEKLLPVKRKNFSCYNIHIYKIFSLIYATIPDPEPASFSPLVVEQELIVPSLYPAIAPSYVPE